MFDFDKQMDCICFLLLFYFLKKKEKQNKIISPDLT